jgi:hypothetical protein
MMQLIIYFILLVTNHLEKIINSISKLFFYAFIFFLTSCNAQIDCKTLNENLIEIQNQSNLPGFALAIIQEGKVVFENGFGFSARDIHLLPHT